MSFDLTPIPVKKADGSSVPMIAYNDGTNSAFAHASVNSTGAIINPATADAQTTGNSALATIAAQTNGVATAAAQATGNASLASVATNTGNLDTNLGAKADAAASSDTGTFSLIALFKRALQTLTTISGAVATSAKQDTQNTALGAPADAAVTNPASSSSIIAALKGILTGVNAATPAGNNLIGKVALDAPRSYTSSTLTRPADTTAYTAGDLVANSTTAGSVASGTLAISGTNDMLATMVGLILEKSTTTFSNAIFKVHFFSAAPTVSNGDNGAFVPQLANYLGAWDIPSMASGSDKASGEGRSVSGVPMVCQPESGTTTIRWYLEARAGYTPGSAETFNLKGKFV